MTGLAPLSALKRRERRAPRRAGKDGARGATRPTGRTGARVMALAIAGAAPPRGRYLITGCPFGVLDIAGNAWQRTDEYLDEHTRAAVIRGGSYYFPQSQCHSPFE